MSGPTSPLSVIPASRADDDDDVSWALQTAAVQWRRGAREDSVTWIRRAAETAIDLEAWSRAAELNTRATQMEGWLAAGVDPDEAFRAEEPTHIGASQHPAASVPSRRPPPPPPSPPSLRAPSPPSSGALKAAVPSTVRISAPPVVPSVPPPPSLSPGRASIIIDVQEEELELTDEELMELESVADSTSFSVPTGVARESEPLPSFPIEPTAIPASVAPRSSSLPPPSMSRPASSAPSQAPSYRPSKPLVVSDFDGLENIDDAEHEAPLPSFALEPSQPELPSELLPAFALETSSPPLEVRPDDEDLAFTRPMSEVEERELSLERETIDLEHELSGSAATERLSREERLDSELDDAPTGNLSLRPPAALAEPAREELPTVPFAEPLVSVTAPVFKAPAAPEVVEAPAPFFEAPVAPVELPPVVETGVEPPVVAATVASGVLEGISLSDVRGLGDLPEDAHIRLVETARIEALAHGEEVSFFAVALVLDGWVSLMPAITDAACATASKGEVVFTEGSLVDGVALRVVAGNAGARVAVWDSAAFASVTSDCPWVADDLRLVADGFQALAGISLGMLGERLDDALRATVTSRCEVRTFLPNELISAAGKPVAGMYIVGAGLVELVDAQGVVTESHGPGDFLFQAQVLAGGPAPRSARAGSGGALVLFAQRLVAHELLVSVPPLLEILAS